MGREVLTASAPIGTLGWLVFVDLPLSEALQPVYAALERTAIVLAGGLLFAALAGIWLARRMVVPIRALATGAARIGGGDLDHRIEVSSGDEVQTLADSFNEMGDRLKEYYATLEHKVADRTRELSEALEQQTATGDVLRVISARRPTCSRCSTPSLATPTRLCEAFDVMVLRVDGEVLRLVAHHGPIAAGDVAIHRGTLGGRTVIERRLFHIENLQVEVDEFPEGSAIARARGHRTTLSVPLLKDGVAIGNIQVRRDEVRPFTDKQIELVTTFADQAVIAIENVRLFEAEQTRTKELTESLEQQTATSEVLSVISSSPGELEPVFQAMLANATRLCGAEFGVLFRSEGEAFRSVALHNAPPAFAAMRKRDPMFRPGAATALARAAATRQAVQIADVQAEPGYFDVQGGFDSPGVGSLAGARTVLAVPMLKENDLVGAIVIYRQQVRPFADKQIELVTSFANQAVIAIENVRLLNETREALDRQTATAEILRVISSSPTDVQPVFDAIARSGLKLFPDAAISIALPEGDQVKAAAVAEPDPARAEAWRQRFPFPLTRDYMHSLAILDAKVVDFPDVAAAPPDLAPGASNFLASGYRAVTMMPMLRGEGAIGVISVVRLAPGPLSDRQVAILKTFADQAVIAIENTRLFEEVQARTREVSETLEYQTATSDVLGVISRSPNELQPVLEAIVETAQRLCELDRAQFFRLRDGKYHLAAHQNTAPEFLDYISRNPIVPVPGSGSATAEAAIQRHTVHVPDVLADPSYATGGLHRSGRGRSTLAVPLIRDDTVIGVITVARDIVKPFTDRQIKLVETFADQALIAIQNTRLFEEVQARTAELTESLEYQTATSDVLDVISRSPSEVQPVLSTIVQTAKRLCEAEYALVLKRADDELYRFAASSDASPAFLEWLQENPVRADDGSAVGVAAAEKKTVHMHDALADTRFTDYRRQKHSKARTMLAIPLLRAEEVIGVIFLARNEVKPFTDKQIELVTTFADQAVIAIENARLFEEVQARTAELSRSVAELKALGQVSQAVNSSLDLKTVLDAILGHACEMSDTSGGAIYVVDETSSELRWKPATT